MIDGLSHAQINCLNTFFAAPNELSWDALVTNTIESAIADRVRPWLQLLVDTDRQAPIILPFVQGGKITGWFATTQYSQNAIELRAELVAWFGPSYLKFMQSVPVGSPNPMAAAMRSG